MIFFVCFEIIGLIAFSISGALTAIEKKLDLFGVVFLSMTTAVGGGILRDLLIGIVPPTAFVDPIAVTISLVTGFIVFYTHKYILKFNKIIVISDALGLAVFTVIGCRTVIIHGIDSAFIAVAMGLSTGIGGGVLRDVLVNHIPFVLKKEIYAVVSILGALCYFYLCRILPDLAAMYICCGIIFFIRLLAIKYNLSLPSSKD